MMSAPLNGVADMSHLRASHRAMAYDVIPVLAL